MLARLSTRRPSATMYGPTSEDTTGGVASARAAMMGPASGSGCHSSHSSCTSCGKMGKTTGLVKSDGRKFVRRRRVGARGRHAARQRLQLPLLAQILHLLKMKVGIDKGHR